MNHFITESETFEHLTQTVNNNKEITNNNNSRNSLDSTKI